MMRNESSAILKQAIWVGCFLVLMAETQLRAATSEELAVYRALFSGTDRVLIIQGEDPAPKDQLASRLKPLSQEELEEQWVREMDYYRTHLPGVEKDLAMKYAKNHPGQSLLTEKSNLGAKLILISQKSLDRIFANKGDQKSAEAAYQALFRKYRVSETVRISRVLFNDSGTQALLYETSDIGVDGIQGDVVFLKKTGGKWAISNRLMVTAT